MRRTQLDLTPPPSSLVPAPALATEATHWQDLPHLEGPTYNLKEALKRVMHPKGHMNAAPWSQRTLRGAHGGSLGMPVVIGGAGPADPPETDQCDRGASDTAQANGGSEGHAFEHLKQERELAFLLSRVSAAAGRRLLNDGSFQQLFLERTECKAFVMAVDIRRSTELMLRAHSTAHFSRFVTSLCEEIEMITKESFGIFDKFTGDGTLAYFPDFYSGSDAGYHVMQAAQRCHEIFAALYKEHHSSFTPVLGNVGLGVGVDYGMVQMVRLAHGLTIVGGPVVYACRLAGGPAHRTYVNQSAFEIIMQRYHSSCSAVEAALEVKHEGHILCHDLQLLQGNFLPQLPMWMNSERGSGHGLRAAAIGEVRAAG
ncbi:MAG: hypothetical protein U0984_16090 [Prosthecobacter sp.]|nr:hypothetical protein [Prosthecobacter sp.]